MSVSAQVTVVSSVMLSGLVMWFCSVIVQMALPRKCRSGWTPSASPLFFGDDVGGLLKRGEEDFSLEMPVWVPLG
jgi:hypothetical protein